MAEASHIESWTADEVSAFLSTLELDQYGDDFMGNEITGDILIHLDHEALRDIGVESVGHRLNILRAVYNRKIADNVTFEPEHYVPATVEFESLSGPNNQDLQKDLQAITEAIRARDERLLAAEGEIKRLTDNLVRLKDQMSPVFKIVKELQPLPTPDVGPTQPISNPSLSRKFSTKKLFLGSAPKQPSPTHTPPAYLQYSEPDSPHSPGRYTTQSDNGASSSSRSHTPNTHSNLPTLLESPGLQSAAQRGQLPPPPRPPPPGVTPLNTMTMKREMRQEFSDASSTVGTPQSMTSSIPTTLTNNLGTPSSSSSAVPATNGTPSSSSSSSSSLDAFKSFRVGLDDPCSKVLPVALKKYRINSDWREYSLFICYADQERCLALDEKPLLVFQELQRANKSPVFMLRKLETPSSAASTTTTNTNTAQTTTAPNTTNILPVRGGDYEMRI